LTLNFVLANEIVTFLGTFLKAIRIYQHGGVEQLRYEEAAEPFLQSADDVIVRVKAATLNLSDVQFRQGDGLLLPTTGLRQLLGLPQRPATPLPTTAPPR
jgi:NADPH:quinone reductase-like Zn-dependent oxidoreductase